MLELVILHLIMQNCACYMKKIFSTWNCIYWSYIDSCAHFGVLDDCK